MSSYPWFKFYPRDWLGNQGLRVVSLAARGLWLEMLAIMHEGQPYARLAVNGKAIPSEMLARMVGASHEEVARLLDELRSAAVFQTAKGGVIHSPRMAKERARSEKGRKGANRRWSQVSVEKQEIVGPIGSPTAQTPDVIPQKADFRREPVGSSDGCRLQAGWNLWPEVRTWTEERFSAVTRAEIDLELDRFVNFWTAKVGPNAIKRDWDAAWKLWAIDKWGAVPVASPPSAQPTVKLHRSLQPELFEACERLQMKTAPGFEWRFSSELVGRAQREIDKLGPPPE